jgi:hypothetical protein
VEQKLYRPCADQKPLGKKLTQITIAFREIPKSFVSLLDCMPKQNRIIFQVAPRNFLSVSFELRPPTGRFIACPVWQTARLRHRVYTEGWKKLVPLMERKLLRLFLRLIKIFLKNKERVHIALAGGKTPMPFYRMLSLGCLPWERLYFYLTDERFKRKVYEKLLKGEDIPASKVKGKRKTFIIYST